MRVRSGAAALPPGRSPADFLPFMVVEPPENPTFSTKKLKIRRGESQKMNQGRFFWWGERAQAPAGVETEPAQLSFYTRNRFELWRKLPP